MGRLLDPIAVEQVGELLAGRTLSNRAIARATGVSRDSVGRIRRGERPRYEELRPGGSVLGPPGYKPDDASRCPGCGGLVALPCLACEIRGEP